MKKRKVLGLGTLALAGVLAFTACGGVKDEDGKAWAEENGYVKATIVVNLKYSNALETIETALPEFKYKDAD